MKELLKLYGNRFPSGLPRKLDFDHVKWCRDEIDMALARMKANIPGEEAVRINGFTYNYRAILSVLQLPEEFPQNARDLPRLPTEEYKQQLYDRLFQWWQKNRDKLVRVQ